MLDFDACIQKLPENVGDLGKLIGGKGFEKLPKVQKSPYLVTLHPSLFFRLFCTVNNKYLSRCRLAGFELGFTGSEETALTSVPPPLR